MDAVPRASASVSGVSEAKMVDAVRANLREEGGSKKDATALMNLAVSWPQPPLACSRLIAPLIIQVRRKQATTEAIVSEMMINYVALDFDVVRSLPVVPTHVQDEFLL